ncbi:hypothetical protein LXL04_005326 [Taraxacum kok-saghyz]
MVIKFRNVELRPKWSAIEIGLLIGTTGLFLVMMILFKTILFEEKVGFIVGNVNVNGTSSVGFIDEDFVCATLDWWPPEKCDYGSCSWGTSSLLNLVSFFSLHYFLISGLDGVEVAKTSPSSSPSSPRPHPAASPSSSLFKPSRLRLLLSESVEQRWNHFMTVERLLYQAQYGSQFTQDVFWRAVKDYEKWRELESFDQFVIHLAKKHKVSESPSSEPSVQGFNLNYDPPQPMGRDEAKRKKRGKSIATSTTSTNSSVQEEILALSGNVETYKEAHQIKDSALKIKEKMQLRKIIQEDISNKTGFKYELALEMKKDAARQFGALTRTKFFKDLNNKILFNAIKAFSPLKLRLGGTLQNKVIYQTEGDREPCSKFTKSSSDFLGFTQGCLPMSRWDELNIFFQKTGAKVIFGLNALSRRYINTNGSVIGPWNSTNTEALMKYTIDKGFTIHGWELGNELCGNNSIGASIKADQYASDTISLQNLVQKMYNKFAIKPLVLGPGGFFDQIWFNEYITKSNNSLQVVTQHIYNLGPGVDTHLIKRILDPWYLDRGIQLFKDVQNILKGSGSRTVAWVGEGGGAWNSGRNHVTNSFVFSFWYLDQMGMASSYDTKTYCRQTLIGGNYGLLNSDTFVPNPDFYSALLWHRLMGRRVLSATFDGMKKIRAYAHCAKHSDGLTLLLINLDKSIKAEVGVLIENVTIIMATTPHLEPTQGTKASRNPKVDKRELFTRDEYHLTAKNGKLNSNTVLLNGKELSVNSTGIIPLLDPIRVKLESPIVVAPFSIVFVHIPTIHVPACT